MTAFSPFSPVDIRILPKTQGLRVTEALLEGKSGVAVLADSSILKRLQLESFVQELLTRKDSMILDRIPANPTASDICQALLALKDRPVTTLVAIGGGSCIDLAKAVSAMYHLMPEEGWTQEAVLEAIKSRSYDRPHPFLDIIALPTTAGTGSEVTRWATVWDAAHFKKLSVDCTEIYPKAAILIPELTASMPVELTLSTGLDALSHAMEAFWAKSRTPLSQTLALTAIDRIRCFLPLAVQQDLAGDMSVREGMCLGALLAGLAFSITRTTACHSISYPLTMLHSVPHGYAAALTLISVMKRNEHAVPQIGDIQKIFSKEGGFSAWLKHLTEPIRPLCLGAFDIRENDLDRITELTFTTGRMDNNPIHFTQQEVLEILRENL